MGGAERPPSAFTGPIAWAIFFGNYTMKNPLLSFALAAAIFAISSGNAANAGAAFSINSFIKQAEVIKANAVVSANSTMIKVSTTIKGFAANDPYMVKNIDVPKANFMSHIKGSNGGGIGGLVKRNAWYAGWFATMAAAGWAIDELTQQVVASPKDFKLGFYYYVMDGQYEFAPSRKSLPEQACKAFNTAKGYTYTSSSATWCGFRVGSYNGGTDIRLNPCNASTTALDSCKGVSVGEPVPQDAIYDSLISHMLQDPKSAAQAFMVPDKWPYPYPQIFPETVPYIPGVSQADQDALELYSKGLLQSTNPNAPYYVTPERYQQIASLAQQLQNGQTPQSEADAMNDALKKPLTQKELEESLKKDREAEEKAIKESLGEKPSFDKLTEPLDKFVENVNKTPQDEINPLPQNNFGIAGSGTCYRIEKPISIMGVTVNMSTRSFCDAYYYPYFLPILTWFFYIATGLYIWFSLRDAYSRRI